MLKKSLDPIGDGSKRSDGEQESEPPEPRRYERCVIAEPFDDPAIDEEAYL